MMKISYTSNMSFIDDSKQASIKVEFEALNKSVQNYFVDVSKKTNLSQNVNQTKVRLIGQTDASDKVLVKGVLQRVESRAIDSFLFQNHSEETIRSTRQLKKMVESLAAYLSENDMSILNETLDSAQMTAEILSNKLDRIERRAKNSDIKLDDVFIKIPKLTSEKSANDRYHSFVKEGSMRRMIKMSTMMEKSSESMVISNYEKHD